MNDEISIVARPAAAAWLDGLGASVSIACAIQCSVFLLLIGVLPVLGLGFLLGEAVEGYFLIAALVLAITGFSVGERRHGHFYVYLFLAGAAALIYTGRQWVGSELELPFVVSGSLLLAGGHLVNRRLCQSCAQCRAPELSQV